jgi:hypothetical protein
MGFMAELMKLYFDPSVVVLKTRTKFYSVCPKMNAHFFSLIEKKMTQHIFKNMLGQKLKKKPI